MTTFLGFLVGRFIAGNPIARILVFVLLGIPVIAMIVGASGMPLFVAQVIFGLAVTFWLLTFGVGRFGTMGCAAAHILGAAVLVGVWNVLLHYLPHGRAAIHLQGWLDATGALRALTIAATVVYAVHALRWVWFVVARQAALEYLFREYARWHVERTAIAESRKRRP